MHWRHRWVEVERIGAVVTYQCAVCSKRKTRVPGPVRDSPAPGALDHGPRPENGSPATTAARRSNLGDAVQHSTHPGPDEIDKQSPDYHG
jgi:hypothetical protein